MKFQITRSKWYRGKGRTESKLRRQSDGLMCCLGQRALACGYSEEQITNLLSPASLLLNQPQPILKGFEAYITKSFGNTNLCANLMMVNDDQHIDDATRESRLIDLFTQIGDEVEFVD